MELKLRKYDHTRSIVCTFNRTAYGIETTSYTVRLYLLSCLLIAPLMELKRIKVVLKKNK